MTKKAISSTVDKFMNSLTSKELKQFNEEYQELLLSEIILAAIEQDHAAVQKLARIAGVAQAVRSEKLKDFSMQSFFKMLRGVGCTGFMVKINEHYIPLEMPINKK